MSNKSKRKPAQRWSRTKQINSDLLVFFWALTSKVPLEMALAVVEEVRNVNDSLRKGLISLDMINRQLIEEFGIQTDWARRDRG